MVAHLVETSEEDSFLAVARHIGDLLNDGQERTALAETPGSRFTTDCETALAQSRYGDLLNLYISQLDVLISKAAEKDLECCLTVVGHVLPRIHSPGATLAAKALAAGFASSATSRPEQRLQALSHLYNVLPDADSRHLVLLQILEYGRDAGLANTLTTVVKNSIDTWAKEYDLDKQKTRELYLAAADLLRSSKRKRSSTKDAFRLTMKAFETFTKDSSAEEVAPVKAVASQAVLEFLGSPDIFTFDMLESPAISQLKDDSQYGHVYQLLVIFLDGDVQAFKSFTSSSASVLESLGTPSEDLLAKVQLMALLRLATESRSVSFAAIQQNLDIDASEVEMWVVRAIGKKLMDARMDQMTSTVAVSRATQCKFGSEASWIALRDQLEAWRDSVKHVTDLVAAQKRGGPPAYQVAAEAIRAA